MATDFLLQDGISASIYMLSNMQSGITELLGARAGTI